MNRRAALALLLASCASAQRAKGPVESFAPAGITDAASTPRRHALLVGIDRFEDARFPPLRYATADAAAFGRALSEFDDVRVLTSPDETTRAAILEEIGALDRRIRGPQDTVVIYFSTHGSLAQPPGGPLRRYLATADTRLDILADTGLSVDALAQKLDSLRSKRLALVLATCHSGRGKSLISDELARALARRKAGPLAPLEDVSEAVLVLSAAAFGESAREDDVLSHDVYTYFLLQALEEGDRDGDGAVTATEAHDFARERTYEFTGGEQRPSVESSVLGVDPIVLRGKRVRTARPVVYSYAPSSDGLAVSVDGAKKGVLPGGIALDPGSYTLRLANARTGRVLFDGRVSLGPGERVDLTNLLPKPLRIDAELAAGALFPLGREARAQLAGTLPTAEARVRFADWPWSSFAFEGAFSVFAAGGEAPSYGSALPFHVSATGGRIAVLREIPLRRALTLLAGAGAGTIWLSRRFSSTQYSASESLRAGAGSALVEADWSGFSTLRVGGRLEILGLTGTIGAADGPHFLLGATVHAGVEF